MQTSPKITTKILKTLKKVLRVIGIVVVSVAVVAFIVGVILSCRPAAPNDYQQTTPTGGAIEAKYMANGPYKTSSREDYTLLEFKKFLVFYPLELETSAKKYPVIVICNGSGTPLSKYVVVAKHLASWGFVVVGTDEKNSWNAFGAEMALRYLERWNDNEKIEDATSVFYQKIDFDNVGVVGHSQGGVGVINAITETARKNVYKTAVSLSPTNKELAHNLFWDYNASLVKIPIFFLSGEGGGDDWVITGEQLQSIYDDVGSEKLMARRVDTPHGETLYRANGYVTAWFQWRLQEDLEAAKAFVGDRPEIMTNKLYCDVQSTLE